MLGGTLALADWRTATLGAFAWLGIENISTPSGERWGGATPLSAYTGKRVDAPPARTAVATVTGSHFGLREPAVAPAALPVGQAATADPDPPESAGLSAANAPVFEAPLPTSRPPPPETGVQLASLSTSDPA